MPSKTISADLLRRAKKRKHDGDSKDGFKSKKKLKSKKSGDKPKKERSNGALVPAPKPKSKSIAKPVESDEESDLESEDELAEKQAEILELEDEISKSLKHHKGIGKLLEYLEDVSEDLQLTAAVALCRTFSRLMSQGRLLRSKDDSEDGAKVVNRLREHYVEYLNGLKNMLIVGDGTAMKLAMRLLKVEADHHKPENGGFYFPDKSYAVIVSGIMHSESSVLVEEFAKEYLNQFTDLRFEFLKIASTAFNGMSPSTHLLDNMIFLLSGLQTFPKKQEDLDECEYYMNEPSSKKKAPITQLSAHRKYFQESWLAVLRQPLEHRQKDVLSIMTNRIIPHFVKPQLLMDFLTDCYDTGGVTSLLALAGLFELMMKHNLDYPNFFPKLYALFDRNLMHVRYRARFFRLVEDFLSSTHLPAILIASFLKRMSRLCLTAPPAAIVIVIPFTYNLLKRHPSCTFMLHREAMLIEDQDKLRKKGFKDPFDENEKDPMKTKALESSLWELQTLQSHYEPSVANIAKIISEQFTKDQYKMEDFLDHSYNTLIDQDIKKVVRKDPVVEFTVPKKIFNPPAEPDVAGIEDDFKLWDFS